MPPRRQAVSGKVRAQIEAMLGNFHHKVASVYEAGRDDLNRPIYMIRSYSTMGSLGLQGEKRTIITRTVVLDKGKMVAPSLKGSALPGESEERRGAFNPGDLESVRVGAPGEGAMIRRNNEIRRDNLESAKNSWLAQVYKMNHLEKDEIDELVAMIQNFQGSPLSLSNMVEQHLSAGRIVVDEEDDAFPVDDYIDWGGGGGGFSGPEYKAPDRRVVEDFVKGTMVSLLGTVQDGLVGPAVDLYMNDHRRDWDSPNATIDPAQSVLEFVRGTEDYKELHALRPESEDERQWVGQRRQAAAQGGLQLDKQEDFGRIQAAIGGDIADVREAGAVKQTAESGTTRGTILEQKVKRAAVTLFEGVR